ncbi:MAG: ATP-binding protein, partial [Myxococcales bacterium]
MGPRAAAPHRPGARRGPYTRGANAVPGPRSSFRASPPFVGRAAEYRWLEERLQLAATGRPQVVLIRGDAGIGKTRLVRELEGTATRAGLRVFHGRAREDASLPYLV